MHRRIFIAGSGAILLFGTIASWGQPTGRLYRIGYLDPRSSRITSDDPSYITLRKALTDMGYVAGRNMIFDERFADRQLERLPELALELVKLKVDVIVAASGPSIRAARDATLEIPIVMAFSGDDPVKSGFVTSLSRPGGNITGVTVLFRELAPKWIEMLGDLVPGMTRLGVLINPSRPAHNEYFATMQAQSPSSVHLQQVEARVADQYDAAFAALSGKRAQAVVILADVLFTQDAARLAALATRHQLPSIYQFREFAIAGGLMAYGPDERDLAALAAQFVDRLLKGAKPSDLPVQQPTKFRLTLNPATAKALGISVPDSVRLRADEVI
jgi:putative ABC transport system substrate-binding protein